MEITRYPKHLLDYRPIGIRIPWRLLNHQTDTVVRPRKVIYWPNLVTRRLRRQKNINMSIDDVWPKRKWLEAEEDYIMRSFITCTLHQILLGWSNQGGWDEHALWDAWEDTSDILVGKPEWNRPLGRPRSRWKENIRMDLSERGWEGVDWIHGAQDRNHWWAVVNTVTNLWFS
jgi:hypothetical protein